jgi:hypothetical protein
MKKLKRGKYNKDKQKKVINHFLKKEGLKQKLNLSQNRKK